MKGLMNFFKERKEIALMVGMQWRVFLWWDKHGNNGGKISREVSC